MTQELDALARELGAPPPDELTKLDAADVQRLTDAIAAAHTRQQELLAKAADDGLRFIPRLVRGPVKKVLFG